MYNYWLGQVRLEQWAHPAAGQHEPGEVDPRLRGLPGPGEAEEEAGESTWQGREAVIVAGGRVTSQPGDELSSVEVMVVGQPYWRLRAPLPQPRLAPAMVVLGGLPLLTGGSYEVLERGRRRERFPEAALQYRPEEDRWSVVARLGGRSHHVMVAVPARLVPGC